MPYFTGRINMTDEHGLSASKKVEIWVDEGIHTTTIAQITAAVAALSVFAEELDEIVDAVLTDVNLTIPVAATGLKTVAGEQGVAEGANLKLETEDVESEPHLRPYFLPSASQGIFNANFRTVDTADADLLAWLDAFDGSGFQVRVSDGETVMGIDSGVYATRRRSV